MDSTQVEVQQAFPLRNFNEWMEWGGKLAEVFQGYAAGSPRPKKTAVILPKAEFSNGSKANVFEFQLTAVNLPG